MSATRESAATRVVLSYRAVDAGEGEWTLADSDWLRERIRDPTYLKYLRRVHAGPIAPGDEFEEFVNCGCASPQDVVIRVEAVEGGDTLDAGTDLEIVHRRDVAEAV